MWRSAMRLWKVRFWLAAGLLPAAGLAPAAGLTFLCFAKEKISKRKASQRPWPCGLPCATRGARGRAQTRFAQTAPALIRSPLRCSARPMAWGVRVCSFASLTLHTLIGALRAMSWQPSLSPQQAKTQPHPPPQPHQSSIHSLRPHRSPIRANKLASQRPDSKTPLQNKETKLGIPAPLHPSGGEGAGGSGGQTKVPQGKMFVKSNFKPDQLNWHKAPVWLRYLSLSI